MSAVFEETVLEEPTDELFEKDRFEIVRHISRVGDGGFSLVIRDKQTNKCWLEPNDGTPRVVVKKVARGWLESVSLKFHDEIDGSIFDKKNFVPDSPDDWPDPVPLPGRGDMGEAPPFPLALLPEAVREAVNEVVRFDKVSEASAAMIGISTLATAVAKRVLVIEREGLRHYPSLFFAGIAPSGERKGSVFRHMTAPLEAWAQNQEEECKAQTRRAQSRNKTVDSQINHIKANKGMTLKEMEIEIDLLEQERLIAPPSPRLFSTNTTEERLFQKMHERGGAFAVMSAEGRDVIDAILGKYSGANRTGDGLYLAGISGDTVTRDRVGNVETGGPEDRAIPHPCLNVCILVQPDKYMELATHPALRSSGAIARIWPAWLPSMAGNQHEAEGERGLSEARMRPYEALVGTLLEQEIRIDEKGRARPHVVRLDAASAEARRQFHNRIQDQLREGAELSDCKDIALKATTQVCKLALIFHAALDPRVLTERHSEIVLATWNAAEGIGRWFLLEAVRVARSAVDDPLLEGARRTLAWLDREHERDMPREQLTAAILGHEGPRPRPKASDAEDLLELLEGYRWVRRARKVENRKPVYIVHPRFRQCRKNKSEQRQTS